MAIDAVQTTEKLRVSQVVSENTQQTVVRGKITVPEPKPDVEKILSTDKTAKIKKIELLPDKAIIEGTLSLQIIYIAFEPAQSVHHMHQQIPFTTFVDLPGTGPDMEALGKVTVEDVNIMPTTTDVRVFDVAAVLSVFVKVTQIRDLSVVTQCPAMATCTSELVKIANVIGSNTKQVIISSDVEIPEEKPLAEKILEVDASGEIKTKRIVKDKVIVDGEVTLQVLYVAAEPDQPVHQLHTVLPFSDFIEVPGAAPGMDVRVEVKVESAEVEQIDGPAGKLRADVVFMLTANVMEVRQINIITSISGVEATMVKLRLDHVVGENSTQVVLRDIFETPEPKPEVEKIIDTAVREVKITETKIIKEKVIVRGYVNLQVIYVAALADQPVHAMHRRLDFSTFIVIPGAKEGMDVDVRALAEFTTAEKENCHVIVELVLKVTAKVTELLQRDVVVAVAPVVPPVTPPPVCPPGQVITYTIKAGDTFFLLAQRFNVSVAAIQQANPGVNPNQLTIGQVVNIPCLPAKG